MRKLALMATWFLLVLAVGVGSVTAAEPKKVASVEGITEYQLDNGFRLLLFPDPSRPTVTVNLTVFVGSRHEGYGETGMAHLLEHMVFKGTPTHRDVPKALRDRGAQFNGTTWVDRTNYFETVPASDDNLEWAIRFEADRMVNSFVRREDLLSEMTVVRNEFESGENSPSGVLMKRLLAAAFEWHNYGKSTIGNRSDIERVPIDNLQAFYKKHYQPDNAMLVVAGRFDEKKALGFVQKYFGVLPRPKRTLDTTYTEEPEQDGERLVTLQRVGDVGMVGVVYHIPAGRHEDFAAIQVLSNVLSSVPSGRLYKALVESRKASSVSSNAFAWHDPGVLMVMAEVRKENSLDEVRDLLLKELQKVVAEGISEQEMNRARQQLLAARQLASANSQQLAIQLSDWAAQGDWRLYFLHRDRLQNVTAEQVEGVARRYLRPSNRTVGLYRPTEKPERVAIPAAKDVQTLVGDYKGRADVAQGEVFDYSPAAIDARTQTAELADGIKAALLPKKSRNEAVNLMLTLHYGNAENLRGYEAAADLLPVLMLRGAKHLTHQQIRDELDKQNARLFAFGNAGTATFSITTKRENLPAVLNLLRQVLREPTLPADELDVLKRQQLAGVERQRTDPSALAGNWLSRRLSPYSTDDVRYVPTLDEEAQRIQAVTPEQVRKLYEQYLGVQKGELTIVGDFDSAACLAHLTETFKGWKASMPYARIEQAAPGDLAGVKHAINTPDKANANYQAGLVLALADTDPDYPALVMGNYILGGGSLSSRLGDRVRQKEGLSYGVGSGFNAGSLDKRATLSLRAICNPANIAKVEKAIQEEVERLLKDGVAEEELDKAKQAYLQSQKVSRSNEMMLTMVLNRGQFTGRTMAYYADLETKIAALTPADVTNALRKHLDPKRLIIVTAGDFEKGPGGER